MDPKHGPASSEQHVAVPPTLLTGTLRTQSATTLATLMGQATPSIRIPATTPDGSRSLITTPTRTPSNERSKFLSEDRQNPGYGRRYGSVESPGGSGSRTPLNRIGKKRWWARKRMQYYIPSTSWIPSYSLSLLGGDVIAGVTVACMLIPQSVSYAHSLAKLNPVSGLFSASIPGIIYAFLGSSRQLNVAPEAALSLLLGQAVNDLLRADPHTKPEDPEAYKIAIATVITLQAGLISFLLGFFRLGFIDVVLSRAMLQGFITAVALLILIEQLIPMFGLTALEHRLAPNSTLEKFVFLFENVWSGMEKTTTMLSFGSLLALICVRSLKGYCKRWWFIYRIPEVLVVVIISTFLCYKLRWDQLGVSILGSVPIPTGRSFFVFPLANGNFKVLHRTTSTAVMISVIGFLDSIVAAKQNSARFGYSISPNRELVALGAANLGASFVPGILPAYGSITRSRINGDVGGRTQMASLICSTLILLATFFLLPYLYYLPKCVLASIICLVVISLLRETPHDVIYYWKMRSWVDLTLMLLTFVFSIIWNVEVGIAVSIIVSLLLVVRRSSKTRMAILGHIPGTDKWKPIDEDENAREEVPGVLIIRIRENLDFANTAQLKERLRRLELYGNEQYHPSDEPRRNEAAVFVFHMSDMANCDASAVQIFYELFENYQSRGVGIFITHLRSGPRVMFEKAGIVKLLGTDVFYDNLADAMARIEHEYPH